jgi:23S rRNA (cytidine1920-2'-O)/16S rRNA (cytidine1409-2'-O)-methyltransferase
VRDEPAQHSALKKVEASLRDLGATRTDSIDSPILGAEGNREFLLYAVYP